MDITHRVYHNYSHQLQAWLKKDYSLHFVFIDFYKLPLCILLINMCQIDKLHHRCSCVVPFTCFLFS